MFSLQKATDLAYSSLFRGTPDPPWCTINKNKRKKEIKEERNKHTHIIRTTKEWTWCIHISRKQQHCELSNENIELVLGAMSDLTDTFIHSFIHSNSRQIRLLNDGLNWPLLRPGHCASWWWAAWAARGRTAGPSRWWYPREPPRRGAQTPCNYVFMQQFNHSAIHSSIHPPIRHTGKKYNREVSDSNHIALTFSAHVVV